MRVVMFYHSLLSDWNHGNAHFLRGIVSEMLDRGFEVDVYEPHDSWSLDNLIKEHGEGPIDDFHAAYPDLNSIQYDGRKIDLDNVLDGADLVIVHEWNDPELVNRIGDHHKANPAYRLLFHDTHHRAVSAPRELAAFDLSNYDGVLAFGKVIRDVYLQRGWTKRAWTWHEAADTKAFYPRTADSTIPEYDLVWIGNWGDEERSAELHEYLIGPVKDLGLRAKVYGVRYPDHALRALDQANIEYGGWLPNFAVPQTFAQAKLTVHVPRRPYIRMLSGIPTIRPFEALACGIPLVSSLWNDSEHLFTWGSDFLIARTGKQMRSHMEMLLSDDERRKSLSQHGLNTIRDRHTCKHRLDELIDIYTEVKSTTGKEVMAA